MKQALSGIWHRTLRRWGGVRLAAMALLLVNLALLLWLWQLDRQAQDLRAALAARRAAGHPASAAPARQMPLDEQVADFVSGFAPASASAADLEQVFQSARQHHIELPRGDYKFHQQANEPLASYSATFPVHADYAAIRDFSADVLRSLPNASLDELRMARSSADSTVLEAVVRFSFVYRR